ncbi:MAG: TlpA family protein disulfide reductase, partial [Ignavibacteria bacterium]|nr:TlpA family protein disulfide reductase [Ignavibacteria bacterium]
GLFVGDTLAVGPEWVGKPAPDFTLATIDGQSDLSLKDLRGYVVVLDFWASWCAPCRRSLPELALLESGMKGVKVLAINIDDERQNGIDFLKRNRVSVIALYDKDKEVVSRYDIPAMPSALIIDKKGIVRFLHVGYTADDLDGFKKQIEGLL